MQIEWTIWQHIFKQINRLILFKLIFTNFYSRCKEKIIVLWIHINASQTQTIHWRVSSSNKVKGKHTFRSCMFRIRVRCKKIALFIWCFLLIYLLCRVLEWVNSEKHSNVSCIQNVMWLSRRRVLQYKLLSWLKVESGHVHSLKESYSSLSRGFYHFVLFPINKKVPTIYSHSRIKENIVDLCVYLFIFS